MTVLSSNFSDLPALHPVAGKLLASLLAAIDAGDMMRLAILCRENAKPLLDAFPFWLTPPESIPSGSPEYHKYLNALYVISKFNADSLGVGGLFAMLVAAEQTNPFAAWEAKINQALDLNRELEWEAAACMLSDHLIDVRELHGFGFSTWPPPRIGTSPNTVQTWLTVTAPSGMPKDRSR